MNHSGSQADTPLKASFHPDVPDEMLAKWQQIADIMATTVGVPSGLIMKVHASQIEVFVTSSTDGNPYEKGEMAELNTGLYCETVMAQRAPLRVPDARQDPDWDQNPDIALGMVSYLGFPLAYPDGQMFGTICVLDNKQNPYSETYRSLVQRFAEAVETDLELLARIEAGRVTRDELRQSRDFLQTAIDALPHPFGVVDRQGRVLLSNRQARALAGGQDSLFNGMKCHQLLHAQDTTCARTNRACPLDRVAMTRAPVTVEHSRPSPDRADRTIEVTAAPVFDANSGVSAITVTCVDITERRQAELALAAHRNQLEELVERRTRELEASRNQLRRSERLASVGTLAAGIAHEINNPVGLIQLAAENAIAFLDRPEAAHHMKKCLDDIVSSAKRCDHITANVLRFAKHEATTKDPIDINDVVRRAIALTRKYVLDRQGLVELQLGKDLPSVLASSLELEQVFVNLIQNAAETAPGAVHIIVRTEEAAGAVLIVVMDDGPGIPQDQIPHVFDPFFTSKKPHGGSGLGLSIVHGIISEHAGTIDVSSTPRECTAFTVALPCAANTAEESVNVQDIACRR